MTLSHADVVAAAARITPQIRRTPVIPWDHRPSFPGLGDNVQVVLKLEQLQLGGSFKLRGAFSALLAQKETHPNQAVVTASGGNHGIGVARAARAIGRKATVYLPLSSPAANEERLSALSATVIRGGIDWEEAWILAKEEAARTGALLLHPFDDPLVICGQGTLGLEILADVPSADLVLCAVGGGGLLAGVGLALPRQVGLVGVEPVGAACLYQALQTGDVVRLSQVKTIAGSLAPRSVSRTTLDLCKDRIQGVALVSDEDLVFAQALLWDELRLRVEPAGAATLAALCAGKLDPSWVLGVKTLVLVVCGANF